MDDREGDVMCGELHPVHRKLCHRPPKHGGSHRCMVVVLEDWPSPRAPAAEEAPLADAVGRADPALAAVMREAAPRPLTEAEIEEVAVAATVACGSVWGCVNQPSTTDAARDIAGGGDSRDYRREFVEAARAKAAEIRARRTPPSAPLRDTTATEYAGPTVGTSRTEGEISVRLVPHAPRTGAPVDTSGSGEPGGGTT